MTSTTILLKDIKTIGELYKNGTLHAVEQPKYKFRDLYLNQISLLQGDITKLEIDAIVNAAKKSLLGGGGVDGAIHRAAGPELLEECRTLNGCETGDAKITKGYNLPSRHVIHTVGPVYSSSDVSRKADELASCYRKSMQLAADNNLKHIAFPSISTGVYGYPIVDATHIALGEVRKFLDCNSEIKYDRVIFIVFSDKDKSVYEDLIPQYFPSLEAPSAAL
ncbi:hypothetical protein SERLA73DRAFT_108208 [Serpula lacrymans var. lacrymans S7.3]|uniref:Macro domain-containing protein n=2 Tax=Serpula lacrymans var. lacrymans TaxID=341189 RepID=F8PYK6_SERL3|nr:uncharacterized protein SERLADRAFT_438166 [Serpula lacrymans var. lacrymans S7.9]EGN98969.1 hypothetical protein SERLA73DRAFT_108208 [Serpula lacrymans var. lacrymans S7.3]EGO24557.1 hypothetical protein SERLADRAFT_438166 [Serpula lacrymans var. lacrymans S7.9]